MNQYYAEWRAECCKADIEMYPHDCVITEAQAHKPRYASREEAAAVRKAQQAAWRAAHPHYSRDYFRRKKAALRRQSENGNKQIIR